MDGTAIIGKLYIEKEQLSERVNALRGIIVALKEGSITLEDVEVKPDGIMVLSEQGRRDRDAARLLGGK